MRDCSGNQFIGTQGELVMYRIFQKEKQYFKVTVFYALSLVKYHMKCHAHDSFEIMYVTSGSCSRWKCTRSDLGTSGICW